MWTDFKDFISGLKLPDDVDQTVLTEICEGFEEAGKEVEANNAKAKGSDEEENISRMTGAATGVAALGVGKSVGNMFEA